MPSEDVTFPVSYPVGFLARTAAVSAVSCLGGLAFLRWVFSRPLGDEFGPAFYTLKGVLAYLAPSLAFSFLAVLLVASLAVFVVAVFASHKVAGPLFRLQRVAGHLRRGVLVGRIHLRAADQGKPVTAEINAWVDGLKEKRTSLGSRVSKLEEAAHRWARATDGESTAEARAGLDGIRDLVQEIVRVASDTP